MALEFPPEISGVLSYDAFSDEVITDPYPVSRQLRAYSQRII